MKFIFKNMRLLKFFDEFSAKNVSLTNLLSNCDVAREKPKFDFLVKIMHIEANFLFMNETIIISLLVEHMARVFML
jgi:hypothetical protein